MFRAKKRELHLTVDATSGISHSLCDASQRDAFLDEVRAKLSVLEELESNKLIILSGDKVPSQSHQQMHDNCIESLKRAADIAAAKNVGILLENIDPEENPEYFLTSVSEGFEIVRSVGAPNVQFLYDFFHDQIAEGNLLAKLEKNLNLLSDDWLELDNASSREHRAESASAMSTPSNSSNPMFWPEPVRADPP